MRRSLVGIVVVIQLVGAALAWDQVDGRGVCSLEDVALLCGGVVDDGERCCQALSAANDRGCFCSDSSAAQKWTTLGGGGLCQLFESTAPCSEDAGSKLPVRKLSGVRGNRKLANELYSSQDNSAEETAGTESSEDEKEGNVLPGVLAAGMGGFLLSCALVCPCLRPKPRPDPESSQTFVDTSHKTEGSHSTSHDTSRSQNPLDSIGSFSSISHKPDHVQAGTSGALTFTMQELMKVTGNFSPSHKIGQGGFGTVYKGKLKDGTIVAVKRAKKDAFETRLSVEFQNELDMLSQVDHLNLVKLIGFLDEKNERILVVEYVPNGNLREHLDCSRGTVLDMATRLDIAIDVAHALTYLHLYADRPIIHRDVKSSNILLTSTFRAKVTDFGFSRVGPTDQGATHVSTQVKGTAGYLDPEYLTTYQLNQKSDVYSFGILVIEIFTGRRPIELKRQSDERVTVRWVSPPVEQKRTSEERVTIRWAFKKFVEGKVMDILDPRIEPTPAIQAIMERLAELAFACSAPTKSDRPTMKKAQEALWNIRKEYQARLANDPGRSPAHSSPHPSRGTYSIPESHASPSAASPRLHSPRLPSPSRSSPNTPTTHLSPSTSNMSAQTGR